MEMLDLAIAFCMVYPPSCDLSGYLKSLNRNTGITQKEERRNRVFFKLMNTTLS